MKLNAYISRASPTWLEGCFASEKSSLTSDCLEGVPFNNPVGPQRPSVGRAAEVLGFTSSQSVQTSGSTGGPGGGSGGGGGGGG